MPVASTDKAARPLRRKVPGGRWLSVALRATHLLCLIWLGAAILGAPLDACSTGLLVFGSGALLFGLDLCTYPQHLREVAGLSVLVKLLLVAALIVFDDARQQIFWSIVIWSAVFSHAPGSLRHRRMF